MHEPEPEPFFRRCRERTDREAPADERENLLAVSQVLARLRYDDERLFELLGGQQAMLELPFLDKLKEEWVREAAHDTRVDSIIEFLTARFGSRAASLRSKLATIKNEQRLNELVKIAAVCESLKDLRTHLSDPA